MKAALKRVDERGGARPAQRGRGGVWPMAAGPSTAVVAGPSTAAGGTTNGDGAWPGHGGEEEGTASGSWASMEGERRGAAGKTGKKVG